MGRIDGAAEALLIARHDDLATHARRARLLAEARRARRRERRRLWAARLQRLELATRNTAG